jgi:type VI secretion system protein ImpI
VPAPAKTATDSTATDAGRALAILLVGAGLPGDALQDRDAETALRDAGAVVRALASGLVQLLRTRALLKRELAVDMTMIGATDNNPLKLAVSEDEAVLALLRPKGIGYLDPVIAAERAFLDLKAHELALLDGLRAALKGLLERFDPAALERELAEGSTLSAILAGGRKAQYWEEFRSRYAELARAAESRFIGELGPDFARAYERRGKDSQ